MLVLTIGILASFVAGTYLDYAFYPKIFVGLPVIFFIAFALMPDTPQYFIARNEHEVSKRFRAGGHSPLLTLYEFVESEKRVAILSTVSLY